MTNRISKDKMKFKKVELEVATFKDGEYHVAYCPALDFSAYGKTLREAQKSFAESVVFFLEEMEESNRLNDYLLSLGWKLQRVPKAEYEPPTLSQPFMKRMLDKLMKHDDRISFSTTQQKVAVPVS
ncbi:MAG TPA: hypothetical protein VHP30_01145 [Ignavibacteriales bacterium]|nr:hypothetical protein [Ignavibacteriales bacterium]